MLKHKNILVILLTVILTFLVGCNKYPNGERFINKKVNWVSFNKLSIKDGKIYKGSELFTGYYNGDYNIKAKVNNGLLDGLVCSQEFRSSEASVYQYKKGKLEGKSYGYDMYKPEIILWEIDFQNGAGELKEYYPDKTLKGKANFIDGKLEGKRFYYFKDGNIKESMTYKNGKLHGEHKTYYEADKEKYIGKYENGILYEAIGWHDNGILALEKKDNIVKLYDYSGHMYRKNDLNEMKQYYYYDTGELEKIEPYLKAEIVFPRNQSSQIYYYNQLGLKVWQRRLMSLDFDKETKDMKNIELAELLGYDSPLDIFNELGQNRHHPYDRRYLYIYGNKSRPQYMFRNMGERIYDEERVLLDLLKIIPIEYDKHGRVLEANGIFYDGMKSKENYKYNERGQLLVSNSDTIGDEGFTYKYDENGKKIEYYKYGTNRKPLKKYNYVYDSEGRKIESYEQVYYSDAREKEKDGKYDGIGQLMKKGTYEWLDEHTMKHSYKMRTMPEYDMYEYYEVFKYNKEKYKVKLENYIIEDKTPSGELYKTTYYTYYNSHGELCEPWSEIKEIGKLLIKKDIRRNSVLLYY